MSKRLEDARPKAGRRILKKPKNAAKSEHFAPSSLAGIHKRIQCMTRSDANNPGQFIEWLDDHPEDAA